MRSNTLRLEEIARRAFSIVNPNISGTQWSLLGHRRPPENFLEEDVYKNFDFLAKDKLIS